MDSSHGSGSPKVLHDVGGQAAAAHGRGCSMPHSWLCMPLIWVDVRLALTYNGCFFPLKREPYSLHCLACLLANAGLGTQLFYISGLGCHPCTATWPFLVKVGKHLSWSCSCNMSAQDTSSVHIGTTLWMGADSSHTLVRWPPTLAAMTATAAATAARCR